MSKKTSPPTRNDEQLMKAYLAGDSLAFDELYRRYSSRLYSYLRKRLATREEADEIFQAAYLKLHQARHQYDPAYPYTQWLFVVAKTTLLDHFRKAGRRVTIDENVAFDDVLAEEVSQMSPDQTLESVKEIEILEDLPPEQRQAVEMRVIEEMSYEQIAEKLSRSQESVRQIVSRALRKLRSSAR